MSKEKAIQATSTPFTNPIITITTHEASFIGTSEIRQLNDEQTSLNGTIKTPSFHVTANKSQLVLKSDNSRQISDEQDNRPVSSQDAHMRATQLARNHQQLIEEQIRVREDALNRLNSIDVSKFSFPNEHRAKTDYTYARTSSYRVENKDLVDDSLGMPNLCRRSRLSPSNQKQVLAAAPSSTEHHRVSSIEELTKQIELANEKNNIYQSMKKAIISSISVKTNNKLQPLSRNLNDDLEDETNQRNIGIQVTDPERNMHEIRCRATRVRDMGVGTSPISVHRNISRIYRREHEPESSLFCSRLFWLVVLLIFPGAMYGVRVWTEGAGESFDLSHVRFDLEPSNALFHITSALENGASFLRFIWFNSYLAHQLKNRSDDIRDIIREAASTVQAGKEQLEQMAPDRSQIFESLSSFKEKIEQKFVSYFDKSDEPSETALMQLEKLNFTMNHLFQQLRQEVTAETVRMVLKELDHRYTTLLEKSKGLDEALSDEHVSFKTLEEYVHRSFKVYDADKTGQADFASELVGASIMFTKDTVAYHDNSRWLTVFNMPIVPIEPSPRLIIQDSIKTGNCWPFRGQKARIFIKLAAKITPTAFSLEHIPKELSLTGKIDSAPQNFTVYGYEKQFEISDEKRQILGSYRYDSEAKQPLQIFQAMHLYANPISVVELAIESNSGNKDYTCVYKFRVHGNLFQN